MEGKRFADSHVHLFHTNPKDVGKMLDAISSTGVTDGTLLAVCPMDEYGVLQNYLCLWWKAHYQKMNLRAFGSFHEKNDLYGAVPYEKQLDFLLNAGCDGIKFIQMKPDVRKRLGKGLDHSSYDAVFDAMEARNIPITIHCADPRTFWDPEKADPRDIARGWFYGDGTFSRYDELYAEIYCRFEKNPNLNVILAHFFFLSDDLEEAIRVMETYPNLRFDLTPGREMYVNFAQNLDCWRKFFETYADRLLFGTDSEDMRCVDKHNFVYKALSHPQEAFYNDCFHITVKGLDLSEETVGKICYENFAQFVGETRPAPSVEFLNNLADRMMADLQSDPAYAKDVELLRKYRQITGILQ